MQPHSEPISDLAPAPSSFSTRAHLQALGRSAIVAVVGVSVWIAIACSASSQAGAGQADPPIAAPVWTFKGATSFDRDGPRRAAASCASIGGQADAGAGR